VGLGLFCGGLPSRQGYRLYTSLKQKDDALKPEKMSDMQEKNRASLS
jgi:hypothetical protein